MSSTVAEQTLCEIFVSHRPQLRRIAQSIVRTVEQTDDVMQDAFVKLVEFSCDRPVHRPLAYCSQVVRNLALDCCRRRSVEAAHRSFDVDASEIEVPAVGSPHRSLGDREALVAIDRALGALPHRTRHVFELYRLEGLTQREIADRVGVSLGLINGMIADAARAIEGCRELLGE